MLGFLFPDKRRLEAVENKATATAQENRVLRAKISRLELELVRRRADVIVGSRDCFVPVPRPGTAAARLLSQNKALRRRASVAEDRAVAAVVAASRDLIRAAEGLERAGDVASAAELRARAASLADPKQEVSDGRHYETLRPFWDSVRPLGLARTFLTRLYALEPGIGMGQMPTDVEAAEAIKTVMEALLEGGAAEAASVLQSLVEVTEDLCSLGAEAAAYALAAELGDAWTEEIRQEWCQAIDDIARALGESAADATAISLDDSGT
jgi:hypothetical protein